MGSEGTGGGGGGDDGDIESDHDMDATVDGDVSVGGSERSSDKSVGVEASTTRGQDSALRELQRKQNEQHNQVPVKCQDTMSTVDRHAASTKTIVPHACSHHPSLCNGQVVVANRIIILEVLKHMIDTEVRSLNEALKLHSRYVR